MLRDTSFKSLLEILVNHWLKERAPMAIAKSLNERKIQS